MRLETSRGPIGANSSGHGGRGMGQQAPCHLLVYLVPLELDLVRLAPGPERKP